MQLPSIKQIKTCLCHAFTKRTIANFLWDGGGFFLLLTFLRSYQDGHDDQTVINGMLDAGLYEATLSDVVEDSPDSISVDHSSAGTGPDAA